MSSAIGREVIWGAYPNSIRGTVVDTDGDVLYIMDAAEVVYEVLSHGIRFI